MATDPDPFEEGQRAARKNIPAEANPYQDGSDEHALWSAGQRMRDQTPTASYRAAAADATAKERGRASSARAR